MKNLLTIIFFCFANTVFSYNKLSDIEIEEIYNKYVKPLNTDEYILRYVPLPLSKNNDIWDWKGKDFPRVIALLEFEKFIKENRIKCTKGLAINGLDPEWQYINSRNIIEIYYHENPEKYDLHILNLPEKDFDFVMVNQTLEHVYDPIKCLQNIYNHMAPGGILYLNVPAVSILHSTPFHYYSGFTPVGIGAVAKAAGFTILSIGQWGNLDYLTKMFATNFWPDYLHTKHPGLNDLNYPIITWIFAIKEAPKRNKLPIENNSVDYETRRSFLKQRSIYITTIFKKLLSQLCFSKIYCADDSPDHLNIPAFNINKVESDPQEIETPFSDHENIQVYGKVDEDRYHYIVTTLGKRDAKKSRSIFAHVLSKFLSYL